MASPFFTRGKQTKESSILWNVPREKLLVFPEVDATSHDAKTKRTEDVTHIHVYVNENTYQMSNVKS